MLLLAVSLQACGSGGDPAGTTALSTPESTVPTTVAQTQPTGLPTPVAAWSLRGDGQDSVGDLDLDFEGDYTLTGDGVAFDGLSGKALTRGPGPLDTTRSLTLSAWVTYTNKLTFVPIVMYQNGEENAPVALLVSGADWNFSTSDYDKPWPANGGANILAPPAVRSNEWVHLAGVSDREAGVIRFYFNGALADEIPANEPFAASGQIIIGEGWSGAIADVAAYQDALTADQIAELYAATKPDAAPPQWAPDPATYADGLVDGTWDYVLSDDELELLRTDVESEYGRTVDEADIRLFFYGPWWWQGWILDGELWLADDGGPEYGGSGLISIDGDQMTITGSEYVTTYGWALDGNELSITLVKDCAVQSGECSTRDEVAAADPTALVGIEHTYTKSGDDAGF
jgi:Concanavalin A-like lectin/glucanases superfamily